MWPANESSATPRDVPPIVKLVITGSPSESRGDPSEGASLVISSEFGLVGMTITEESTMRAAMEAIDRGAMGIALVVQRDTSVLLGTVSDGDTRRALLGGAALDDFVAPYVSRTPMTVTADADRSDVLDLMSARGISQVPIVGTDGRILGLHLLREMIGGPQLPNWAVIMAGGRGRRLAPLTDSIPKPMIRVAGRPILERLVLHLVGSGIRRIFLAVNYMAEVIEAHFGDGSDYGCSIEYLREDPDHPLGTGGALGLLRLRDAEPAQPLLVLNGDLVTQFSIGSFLGHHSTTGAVATLGVRTYVHEVPFGVVKLNGREVMSLDEKPLVTWTVNAGVYVLEPSVLTRIPSAQHLELPALIGACILAGELVSSWKLDSDWLDVGRTTELKRARGEE